MSPDILNMILIIKVTKFSVLCNTINRKLSYKTRKEMLLKLYKTGQSEFALQQRSMDRFLNKTIGRD